MRRDPIGFEKGVGRDPDDFGIGVGVFCLKNQATEPSVMGHIWAVRSLIDP